MTWLLHTIYALGTKREEWNDEEERMPCPHRVDRLVGDRNNNQIIAMQFNKHYYYGKYRVLQKHRSLHSLKNLEMDYEKNKISAETRGVR